MYVGTYNTCQIKEKIARHNSIHLEAANNMMSMGYKKSKKTYPACIPEEIEDSPLWNDFEVRKKFLLE